MNNKNIILLGLFVLLAISFASFTSAVCCERTDSTAWCQDVVDRESCDDGYRISDNTACESTSYCSEGTCVNRRTGQCTTSPQTNCDPTRGGFWYDAPVPDVVECNIGCCITGDSASLVSQIRCNTLGSDYNLVPTFDPTIQDIIACSEKSSPDATGACVAVTDKGRECEIITREKCQESEGEFHEGFLCTAPELGTTCATTKRTQCQDGKNEVYFVDSCGNFANIYDANKVEDVDYWTHIKSSSDPEETCGLDDPNGNRDSETCGSCNYILGTTCGEGDAQFGKNTCNNLGCEVGELAKEFQGQNGRFPEHGEAWCANSNGVPYDGFGDFENALPGQLSYRFYCYDGEVQNELCGYARESLCLKDTETQAAACVPNRWQTCSFQTTTDDCENEDKRDCKVVEGATRLVQERGDDDSIKDIVFEDENGEEIKAVCVPRFPPALSFWDPQVDVPGFEGRAELQCQSASSVCGAVYTKSPIVLGGLQDDTEWLAWESTECAQNCIEICQTGDKQFLETTANCQTDCLKRQCSSSRCFVNGDTGNADKDLSKELALKSLWVEGQTNSCSAFGDCGLKPGYYEGTKSYYDSWDDFFKGNYTKDSLP